MFSGITAGTAKHLQLDAGVYIKNYDLSKDFAGNKANILGATANGGSFSAVPTVRHVELDGRKGSVKGFERVDEWTVTMTANVKELTAENIQIALAAAKKEAVTQNPAGYSKITGKPDIEDSDYINNIAWVGRISGSQKPVIIIIYNALATNGLSLSPTDKNEGVVPITLTGHFDVDNLDKVPFDILYPDIT